MARPLRVDIEDGWYHVMFRGTERMTLFADDRDREHLLELLERAVERFRIRIHAYALMRNHAHLVVVTPDANLSQAMQWLKLSYSAWFNARHDRVGPLFQGRFKGIPVENSAWAYEVSLYVHLNPIMLAKLGLNKSGKKAESLGWKKPNKEQVKRRLEKLRAYKWSSYKYYAGYQRVPDWLTVDVLLDRASSVQGKQGQSYRRDAKQRITKGLSAGFEEKLKEGFALGAKQFGDNVRKLAKVNRESPGRSKLRARVSCEQVIAAVESLKKEKYDIFVNVRGDWGKPLVMWGLRNYCGMSLREIGEKTGGRDYAAVSVMIRRFCL